MKLRSKFGFNLFELMLVIMIIGIFSALLLPATSRAAVVSITVSNTSITSTGAVVFGGVSASNIVDSVTNAVDITLFYGGADGGNIASAWSHSKRLSTGYTDGNWFTNIVGELNQGAVIYYNARAQDLTGETWAETTSRYWTNSAATGLTPDTAFRNNLSKALGTNPPPALVGATQLVAHVSLTLSNTVITLISNDVKFVSGTLTGHLYRVTGF